MSKSNHELASEWYTLAQKEVDRLQTLDEGTPEYQECLDAYHLYYNEFLEFSRN